VARASRGPADAAGTRYRVPVTGHERIEVDEVPYSPGDVLERPGDHEPAVGEAEQHDVAEVLVPDGVDDVGDMRGQGHLRTGQVRTLADAGQAGREDLVAGRPERAAHLAEAVRAAPRAVHQDENRHQHQPFPPPPVPVMPPA
jgi:hypothetical protein